MSRLVSSTVAKVTWRLGLAIIPSFVGLEIRNALEQADRPAEVQILATDEIIDSFLTADVNPAYNSLRRCVVQCGDRINRHTESPDLAAAGSKRPETSYEMRANVYRKLSASQPRTLRRMDGFRTRLKANLRQEEQESLNLRLRMEEYQRSAHAENDELQYLQARLAHCYQGQGLHADLAALLDQYEQEVRQLFCLAADAENLYADYVRRLRLERDMRSARFVPLHPLDLSGRAWEVLSVLRETEQAIAQTLEEMAKYDQSIDGAHQLRVLSWADVASLIVILELTSEPHPTQHDNPIIHLL